MATEKLIEPACYREYRTTRREQSEAGTLVARSGKKMKQVGINKEAFAIFEKLSGLETDEAVVILKAVIKYGSWADKPFATQQDLFVGLAVEKPKPSARREFTEFEIEDEGYKAGFGGQPIDSNPHAAGEADNPAYALWRTGWQKGQAALVHKTFQGKEPTTAASPGRRGKPRRGADAAEPANEEPSTPTKH